MLTFSDSEYSNRQSAFLDNLPENSIVLIPTNPRSVRSNDTHYPFRANSYMLYLCGWSESDSVWMASNLSGTWSTSLFVPPQDTKAEIWEGRRAGPEGAANNWPVDSAYSIADLLEVVSPMIEDSEHIFCIDGLNSEIDSILQDCGMDILDPKKHLESQKKPKIGNTKSFCNSL